MIENLTHERAQLICSFIILGLLAFFWGFSLADFIYSGVES